MGQIPYNVLVKNNVDLMLFLSYLFNDNVAV